jgi:hypothetical protein
MNPWIDLARVTISAWQEFVGQLSTSHLRQLSILYILACQTLVRLLELGNESYYGMNRLDEDKKGIIKES